jgi:hypothetical protein
MQRDQEPPSTHRLVTTLAECLEPQGIESKGIAPGTAKALSHASNLPQLVVFAGFLGDSAEHPDGKAWQVLYVNMALTDRVVIEEDGILQCVKVYDETVPKDFGQERDMLWVKADAAVGQADASQSVQAQFLSGGFIRAGDFEAPLAGGTLAAATGVFCEARTPSCCRYYSRPRP